MNHKVIAFFDLNGKCLFSGGLSKMKFKEDAIIDWSKEIYNDDELCIIHRSFIVKKMILEVETYFFSFTNFAFPELDWDLVPERIRYLPDYEGIKFVRCEI